MTIFFHYNSVLSLHLNNKIPPKADGKEK